MTKFPSKMYFFSLNLDRNLNRYVIFDQKLKNMGSLGDKFGIFDQKLKKTWGLWVTEHNFKGPLCEE